MKGNESERQALPARVHRHHPGAEPCGVHAQQPANLYAAEQEDRARSRTGFGALSVVPVGGRKKAVNIWELDGLDGVPAYFRSEPGHRTTQDERMAKWGRGCRPRSGGNDRLIDPRPGPAPLPSCARRGARGVVRGRSNRRSPGDIGGRTCSCCTITASCGRALRLGLAAMGGDLWSTTWSASDRGLSRRGRRWVETRRRFGATLPWWDAHDGVARFRHVDEPDPAGPIPRSCPFKLGRHADSVRIAPTMGRGRLSHHRRRKGRGALGRH